MTVFYVLGPHASVAWQIIMFMCYGPRRKKTSLLGFANNKGANQPAHPRRLISAFVIRFLQSIIARFATSGMSIF